MKNSQRRGPIVECNNLSMRFGNNVVLKNINFIAKPGEIHAIIGPNGGGKSTFIKSLLGQLHHEGVISFTWPTNTEGIVSYVPQIIEVDKTVPLTVENFITLCIQKMPAFFGIAKKHKEEVNRVLKTVNMNEKRKYLFSELSGGERQRVLFAQALIPAPDLLILDEPMNSIDKIGASIFSKIIEELKNNGVTIIWIHHDLAEVKEKADQVTCINKEILFSGVPKEVMTEENLLKIFSAQSTEEEN